MFKKKSNTLSRPKPPDKNHMLEDLENTNTTDAVFTLMKNNPTFMQHKNCITEEENKLLSDNIDITSTSATRRPQDIYENVKSFVEANASLQHVIKHLQEQNESLQVSDWELKRLAEDIRKQAQDALK